MYKYFSTGQYKNIIKAVNETANYHSIPVPTLKFIGTVKLHGTNASVFKDFAKNDFITQSKNNIITPEEDNAGFSAFLHETKTKAVIEKVFDNIAKLEGVNTDKKIAVIYGEWCGGNIQKGVALSELPKMFVIFKIKIADVKNIDEENPVEQWLTPKQMKEVLNGLPSELRLYSIFDFKTWEFDIDMANPKLMQNKLIEVTTAVEKECPVGKHFGISGIGEGVVWTCVSDNPIFQKDTFVFKVKGEKHSVSHVKTIAEVDVEKVNSIKEFAEKVLTENRLKQGMDYLKEQRLDLTIQNMGTFLKWVVGDCLKEESDMMVESGLDKKEIAPALSNIAKKWYILEINKNLTDSVEMKKIKP